MANGRVRVGFSKPWVAKYSNTGSTVSYSEAMPLARGVSVNVDVTTSDGAKFYADNSLAESEAGIFNGGTLTLTCDDPNPDAKAVISGTEKAGADGWVEYTGDEQKPYLGVGWIVEYVSSGVHSWVPTMLTKVQLINIADQANTREDGTSYQTSEETFDISRDDSEKQTWKRVNEAGFSTEAAAEEALKKVLGYTTT